MIKLSLFIFICIFFITFTLGFHTTEGNTKRKEIQQSAFRVLTAVAYRNAQYPKAWCGESKVEGGRLYEWSDFRGVSIHLVDLLVMLQFDPECETNLLAFKDMMLAQEVAPTAYVNASAWWEDTFLIKALDAFTCGFNGSKMEDHDFVSHDLRENFDTDPIKQKLWYLIGDYMQGIYHQRENNNRRLDFDAGLYIPFLDKYTGGDYTKTQQMRVGFPTYMGRAWWYLFHTISQRISDSECAEQVVYDDLVARLKSFLIFFGRGGIPCPFCLFHFSYHVSINDRYAEDLDNEAIRYYPIEYLLLGGVDGTLISKISSITSTNKHSPALFFWKLHNAVTSSVEMGCSCFSEEIEDKAPFNCVFSSSALVQSKYPRFGRAYPFSKRFEFILSENHNYSIFDEARSTLESTLTNITNHDSFKLRSELWYFWNNQTKISNQSLDDIKILTEEIDKLSNEFLKLNVLKQYTYSEVPLNCSKITESIVSLKNTKEKLVTPGEVPHILPEVCKAHPEVSACQKQYAVRPPKKNNDLENKENNSFKIQTNFIVIGLLLVMITIIF